MDAYQISCGPSPTCQNLDIPAPWARLTAVGIAKLSEHTCELARGDYEDHYKVFTR